MLTFLVLAASASATTIQNAGFTATTYATGYASDASARGPRATAWWGSVLWALDAADGGLYRADAGAAGPGPLTSLVAVRVNDAPIAGGLRGIAAGTDGRLYATLESAEQVVELSPTDGAVVRVLTTSASLPCPRGVATDPRSGDLIVTGCTRVRRIADPAGAAAVSVYARLASGIGSHAIAIGPDGSIFVVSDFGLYAIESTALAARHGGTAVASPMSAPVGGIVGIAVVTDGADPTPRRLLASTAAGAVHLIGIATPDTLLVLDGAGAGEQLSLGPDRCAYASMGPAVLRIADADGTCALWRAGAVPPSLSLANTTGQDAHVNGPVVTVRASLTNATALAGHEVTLTISGVHTRTVQVRTDAGGTASYGYVGLVAGRDTIVATALVDGVALASNAVVIDWLPETDTAAPTISFAYRVPAGGTGSPFDCPAVTSDARRSVACGWFTAPPTIRFTVTANGPSGLGALAGCGEYTLGYQPGPEGHHQTCVARNGDGDAGASLTVIVRAILRPPSIVASATAGGVPYVAGTVTAGPVTVRFACASPVASGLACPGDQVFADTGTYTATGEAVDAAGQRAAASFGPIVVDAPRVATALAFVSPPFAATGSPARARLVAAGGAPIAGETVRFAAGGITATATTDAQGVASATLGLAPGAYAIRAAFDGTARHHASAAAQDLVVYEMTRFVVWGGERSDLAASLPLGSRVTFWGPSWAKRIAGDDDDEDGERTDFKGFASWVGDGIWVGRPGASAKPPKTVARYIGVIVTTRVRAAGDRTIGNVAGVAVLRVDGYTGRLGARATGTVLAVDTR